jgi:hypothetical protein
MSDYPIDGGAGMSQVHHGEKMLIDTPPGTTTPTVRVNGKIFFVGELLQCASGAYFIPERFFQRDQALLDAPPTAAVYALGRDVKHTDVRYICFAFSLLMPSEVRIPGCRRTCYLSG